MNRGTELGGLIFGQLLPRAFVGEITEVEGGSGMCEKMVRVGVTPGVRSNYKPFCSRTLDTQQKEKPVCLTTLPETPNNINTNTDTLLGI